MTTVGYETKGASGSGGALFFCPVRTYVLFMFRATHEAGAENLWGGEGKSRQRLQREHDASGETLNFVSFEALSAVSESARSPTLMDRRAAPI
jgi:hypothetical protein